ncbi:MAG TPA: 2-amino-4-hydroxy-6-hydroxymethyldihydropteridine diphosphokinase [Rhizomicrobium sp.]|jgi:2-amino-4-hydroxy-6-hydroxymethyldihydropteridine diphosphokinase|nr:2-amino-4-hydroxy-6-hydroxymethyldihydropteridine diphosphokinase [Rhizomicrobium sp.]
MILIALGANLPSPAGPPRATLEAALHELRRRNISVPARSNFYKSRAWPDPREPCFINAVAEIEAKQTPRELLVLMREIEIMFGRTITRRNAPRTLDLDLLDYNGLVEAGTPILPHPRLQERAFVLVPLSDVAPDWRHPVSGLGVRTLIAALPSEATALTKLP